MEHLTGLVAIITPMGVIAALIVLYFVSSIRKARQRHAEAMALIERGQYDPALLAEPERKYRKETFLLVGIIFLAIGIALLIGVLIFGTMDGASSEDPADFIIGGLICFFTGVGLIVFYAILWRIEKQRLEREQR